MIFQMSIKNTDLCCFDGFIIIHSFNEYLLLCTLCHGAADTVVKKTDLVSASIRYKIKLDKQKTNKQIK